MARVRAAGVFGRSRQLQRLFDYLAGCALRQHVPKEAEVAIEAFGRDAGFDGARDTSVRVVVHKLRQRLDTYYGRPGTITAGRLRVPRGEYRLAFEPEGVPLAASGLHGTLPSPAWWQTPWTRRERAGVLLLAVLIVALAALGWRLATRPSVHRPAGEALQLMPWQPLQQGRLPIMVALGDYFIFGERDAAGTQSVPSRLVREFDINSRRDLQRRQQADPALARRGMDLDLGYLPTSVGVALNDVLPVLAATGRPLRVAMASELTPEHLKTTHVVYLGLLSGLGLLEAPLFSASRFSIEASYDTLLDTVTGTAYVSEAGLLRDDAVQFRDYGYVAAFTGPAGNAHLVIAGTRDVALRQMAELLAQPARLRDLQAAAGGARDFEALYEVVGVQRTNIEARRLVVAPLQAAALWSLPDWHATEN